LPGEPGHSATATYEGHGEGHGEWRDDRFGEVFEFKVPAGEPMDWAPTTSLADVLSRGHFWAGCERIEVIYYQIVVMGEHVPVLDDDRRTQRANRKRRAARKRKRGWA
jgi:hypothetical protein